MNTAIGCGDLMVYISGRIPEELPVYEAINVSYSSDKQDILLSTPQTALSFLPLILKVSDEALKKKIISWLRKCLF